MRLDRRRRVDDDREVDRIGGAAGAQDFAARAVFLDDEVGHGESGDGVPVLIDDTGVDRLLVRLRRERGRAGRQRRRAPATQRTRASEETSRKRADAPGGGRDRLEAV